MRPTLRLLALGALIAASACASSSGATRTRSDPSQITAAELAGGSEANLYDYIAVHRPRWMQGRGGGGSLANRGAIQTGSSSIAVYVDQTRLGSVDLLKQMPRDGVKSIRYYTVTEAQQRFSQHESGAVIQVFTK